MLILEIDKDVLDKILHSKGISSNQLIHNLRIRTKPTSRLLTTWTHGGVVAERWRAAIAVAFLITESELFDKTGHMYKLIMVAHGITRHALSQVSIEETVTRGAVTNWRNGGGIEPDKLLALAAHLGVPPSRLLSRGTQSILKFLTHD